MLYCQVRNSEGCTDQEGDRGSRKRAIKTLKFRLDFWMEDDMISEFILLGELYSRRGLTFPEEIPRVKACLTARSVVLSPSRSTWAGIQMKMIMILIDVRDSKVSWIR